MAGAEINTVSGNFITAQPMGVLDGVDLQYTGTVRKVDAAAIESCLASDDLVIISNVGYSPTGEVFNLSMEDVAVAIAKALRAAKLVFLGGRSRTRAAADAGCRRRPSSCSRAAKTSPRTRACT
jgi:amino-acid N-acetyltransferase